MLAALSTSAAAVAKSKASNQQVLNSVALTNESDLAIAIGAGETWVIQWSLVSTFSATGGLKVAVTTPASATQLIAASIASNGIVPASGTTGTSGTAIVLSPAAATGGNVTVSATVVNSTTAGNVTLQFAQNALDAVVPTILLALSNVSARKV